MSEGRLIPIDEILNQVHESLNERWKRDPFDKGRSDAVRWIQDIVYYSMTTPTVYEDILIIANEIIEEG